MNRNAVAKHLLIGLEIALQAKAEKERLIELHDKLADSIRSGAFPDWDLHPRGRDWFLQHRG